MKIFSLDIYTCIILMTLLKHVYLKRRPKFPIEDQQQNDAKKSNTRTRPSSRDLSICSKCHDMFVLSERESKSSQDIERFCVRLLQVKRCIKKMKKENSHCAGIAIFSLGTGVFLKQKQYRCSTMNINANSIVNIFKANKQKKESPSETCQYKQPNKTLSETRHCGMFGDPHVRTFYDVRQTCVVAGAWSLLDNDYLAVQVTNQVVQTTESNSATATSKITVIFKETDSHCTSQKIYEATSSHLPEVFKDGTTKSGPNGCKTVVQKENADKIVITSCNLNTVIIIRKTGDYLIFNIQTPFEFANKSRGLCHSGCPISEIVDSTTFFENKFNDVSSSSKFFPSRQDAIDVCSASNLTDFYFDSCVFDLLTTGDRLFSRAAHVAMLDALKLDSRLRLRRENSIVLQKTSVKDVTNKFKPKDTYSSAQTFKHSSCNILILFTLLFILIR